jgi:alanine racemase
VSGHTHTARIELSESALRRNVRFLRRVIGKDVVFSSVVKGNAYGHGIEAFVPLAERCGVRHFSAFSADEASRILSCKSRRTDVMIMGDMPNAAVDWAVAQGVSFYVFEPNRLTRAIKAARRLGRPARVHLELETGLHRTGLEKRTLDKVIRQILEAGGSVSVEGVCTHFAGAESVSNYVRIQKQNDAFRRLAAHVESQGVSPKRRHTACSAAALNYPETRLDMVRFGIAQYGFWPTRETRMQYYMRKGRAPGGRDDPLKRVMSWKSRVMSLKRVRSGDFVGYGSSYQASRAQRLAAVPIGYFHGFSRSLSNLGFVLIREERAPVVGLVNMNMMMVDVTDIPGTRIGDDVVIIGKQERQEITVASFSDLTNYLNYEVLVRIPNEIPRIVVA